MILGSLLSDAGSRLTDKNIEVLQDSVKALNYELSLLRYKDSDDPDVRLAYEYLKEHPFSAPLFPYEKLRRMSPVEIHYDKGLKMSYVMHDGHPLYFPVGEKRQLVGLVYRYSVEDDDIVGKGYRQLSPHACQSGRFHIEEGDVLIDAAGWTILGRVDDSTDELLSEVMDDLLNDGHGLYSLRRAVVRASNKAIVTK